MKSFLEFFAGGGMARIGLGAGWRCLLANDFDAMKCAAYRENFGDDDLLEADIASLGLKDLPKARADLAWGSFPCQDLSLAGARALRVTIRMPAVTRATPSSRFSCNSSWNTTALIATPKIGTLKPNIEPPMWSG